MRTTLLDAKNSRIPSVLNISPEDDRFPIYLNEAMQRLIQTGEMFWGLYGRYAFCVDNSCITWPRQIASIQSVAVCEHPIPVRNGWFEFLSSGYGIQGDSSCGTSACGSGLLDRGTACTIVDILGTNKKIKVYADVAEADGAVITLQGNDENGNWIRTQVGGEWIDGQQVALNSTTPQTSARFFSSLVSVQKPETNGTIRLYEYDTTLLTQRVLAVYEPDETNPVYRRSYIPGIPQHGCCGETTEGCTEAKVTVMAKLEFIPVKRDADWLLIGNLPALKDELQSVMKYENNLPNEGAFWHAKAVAGLRAELRHYVGNGIVQPMKMQPRILCGAAVRNMI